MQPSTIGHSAPVAAVPLIGVQALEAIKWLAVVLMLTEHFCHFVLGHLPYAVMATGRLVFPLFALALAVGCAHKSNAERFVVVQRLLVWALVAALARVFLLDWVPLNVVFTLAAGLAVNVILGALGRGRFIYATPIVLIGSGMEFGSAGVLAVHFFCNFARDQSRRGWMDAVLASALVCLANGNFWALAAMPVAISISNADIELPRVKRLFYWSYVGQWPLFAAMKALL